MKKHLLAAFIAAAAVLPALAKDADPVLMTVDGHDVRVSEFEYLYNKNKSQQLQPQTIDEYLQMFIEYKLKVADAEHAGLQDTPEFVSEYNKYRAELAAPYMRDTAVEDSLVRAAYEHRKYDVLVSHIMLERTPANKALLDSIRTAIVAGNTTFEAEARKNSIDRGSSARGGLMGMVIPDRFPYAFEDAAYNTAPGEISPVTDSGMGYHIIRVEKKTPAEGEVEASHILRLTQGRTPGQAEDARRVIDSIYTLVKGGVDFADLARRYSEDPGSARMGGALGWFSRGTMVHEFDSVSFALPDGAISEPFATNFGYHIVKRTGHRGVPAFEDVAGEIRGNFSRDERADLPRRARIARYLQEYKGAVSTDAVAKARKAIEAAGSFDSVAIAEVSAISTPVATYSGGKISFADIMPAVLAPVGSDVATAVDAIELAARAALEDAVSLAVRDNLQKTEPDYRNLVNEYHDGILLYEISNRNVWERASKDREGLEAYFKANAAKYSWEQPKFKSYIFFAENDSLLDKAVVYADSVDVAEPTAFVQAMRTRFGRDIKIERVIAAKGENAITDFLGFDGPRPEENKSRWKAYRAYKGRILDAPEEAADVRGAAVTDYQNELDRKWVAKLHKKYKVKVNKKVFKELKAKY